MEMSTDIPLPLEKLSVDLVHKPESSIRYNFPFAASLILFNIGQKNYLIGLEGEREGEEIYIYIYIHFASGMYNSCRTTDGVIKSDF